MDYIFFEMGKYFLLKKYKILVLIVGYIKINIKDRIVF